MKELLYLNKYFVKYRFSLGIIFTIIAQIFMLFTPKLISVYEAIEAFSENKDIAASY
jgi:ATP-binding cassette subfamily B protein